MKSFKKFLEEVDIKGNPGIPGEEPKRKGEPDYLSDVERRAKQRLNIRPEDAPRMGPMGPIPSRKEMQLGMRLMDLLRKSMELSSGKEEEFSKLATDIIYNQYKDLIDRYEIELDIKLVRPGGIKPFMDEEDDDREEAPKMRRITDEDTIREIHKRKLINLITQGEAKNTKHMLHLDEVKQGFNEILGDEDGEEFFKILDELAKTADQLDWIIPEEFRAEMMEMAPDGLAGAASVGWKPKEKEEKEEEEEEEEDQEPEYQEPEEDQEEEYTEEEDDSVNVEGKTPILRARGVDFSMLLHESVKGLFLILSMYGLPVVKDEDGEEDQAKTKDLLNKIYSNTDISDEPQDWKYGPEIAADLRDFVNKNEKIDTYPNLREELWRVMLDKETMKTSEFIELMRGILAKTPEARIKIDRLIDGVVSKMKKYSDELEEYNRQKEEYDRQMKEYQSEVEEYKKQKEEAGKEEEPESDIDKLVKKSLEKEEPKEDDYSTWTQRELQDEIDASLDSGDYERVKILSKYLKEGKIYLDELEKLNERPSFKIKQK